MKILNTNCPGGPAATTVVPAPGVGRRIEVHDIRLQPPGATTAYLEETGGTDLFGSAAIPLTLLANAANPFPALGVPFLVLGENQGLVVQNLHATNNIYASVWYEDVVINPQ